MNDFQEALAQIARIKSVPFCYGCYSKAPSGRCTICGSDDLMLEYPGCGVEYGTEWIIREILREHLTPANLSEAFEQSVTDCYPETVKIGWIEHDTVSALKELDPVSWSLALSEYADTETNEGNIVTFDNGECYYWAREIEQFIEANVPPSYAPSTQ
jgi:hypothetical protein